MDNPGVLQKIFAFALCVQRAQIRCACQEGLGTGSTVIASQGRELVQVGMQRDRVDQDTVVEVGRLKCADSHKRTISSGATGEDRTRVFNTSASCDATSPALAASIVSRARALPFTSGILYYRLSSTKLTRCDRMTCSLPKPSPRKVERVMRALAHALTDLELPAVEKISNEQAEDPFQILIATLLSARTQDATTHAASTRLFSVSRTPRAMAKLTVKQIEQLIYPVSFYRNKAVHVRACCDMLMSRFGGRVPSTMEELTALPGVGRKTANLVLILAFHSRENICVDTHVHRISNRLGWVSTTLPDETEQALYRVTERRWWPDINLYLVTWGQNVCRPVSPRCGECVIEQECPKIGVTRRTT